MQQNVTRRATISALLLRNGWHFESEKYIYSFGMKLASHTYTIRSSVSFCFRESPITSKFAKCVVFTNIRIMCMCVCVYIILIVDINAETFAEAYSTVRSSCSTSCNPEKKNQKKIVPDVFTVYISLFMDYACKSSSSATQIFARSHSFATELLQLSENQEPDTPRGRGGSIDDIGGLYHHCVCLRRNKTHTMTERFHNTMHKPRPPRWVPNSPSGWVTSHVNYYQPVAILLCRLSSSSKLQTV